MAEMTLTDDAQGLFYEAVYELDKLSRILPGLVPLTDDQTHYAVKGVAGRMVRLSGVLMQLLGAPGVVEGNVKHIINFESTGQG